MYQYYFFNLLFLLSYKTAANKNAKLQIHN